MIVDASALAAILLDEPEAEILTARLVDAPVRLTHPISRYEATLAVARERRRDIATAKEDVAAFLAAARIEVIEIGDAEASAALDAFARYGKGRGHPAQLNLGDCFSHACAKVRGLPLLYKGRDFAETDLA